MMNQRTRFVPYLLGLLAVVLLANMTALTQADSPIVCPANRPYYLSNGVVDGVCYSSCSKIPFGRYVASSDPSVSPFSCVSVPQYNFVNNGILDIATRLSSGGQVCRAEDVAMFFSWVSYEYDPVRMTGLNMSAALGYHRLKSCGHWQIINEIHNENDLLNSHASIAVNDQAGVIVLAFKGTELEAKRWKEVFIDWVFSDFYALLTDCTLSPLCDGTKVHPGFQKSVMKIRHDILNQIQAYLKAGYLLLLTGHSKGAAMSTMATVLTTSHFTNVVPSIHRRVYNINFGSPMTGNKHFTSFYNAYINDDRTLRFVDRFFESSKTTDDLVTTVPGSVLGYTHVKNPRYTHCEKQYFGNPNPIPGISFQLLPEGKYLPVCVGCHFQECYMDGMMFGKPTIKPKRKSHVFSDPLVVVPEQSNQSMSDTCREVCTDLLGKVPQLAESKKHCRVMCRASLQKE